MDDKELLLALNQGDAAALAELFQRYGRYTAAIAAKTGGGQLTPEDVEEITSDIFIRIWQNSTKQKLELRGTDLRGYMAKSARNGALDVLRRNSGRTFTDQTPEIAALSAENQWLQQEDIRSLEDRICALPTVDRDICRRRYFQGEKIKEIGQALGMEESAVSVRLTRIRKKLREAKEREEAL